MGFSNYITEQKLKFFRQFCEEKVLKFDLGHVVMTVFEPITSQHFGTTLSQNNVISNAIKRDRWIAIITVNVERLPDSISC